jgi:hypothetical protein
MPKDLRYGETGSILEIISLFAALFNVRVAEFFSQTDLYPSTPCRIQTPGLGKLCKMIEEYPFHIVDKKN